jgi:hypothetical protein
VTRRAEVIAGARGSELPALSVMIWTYLPNYVCVFLVPATLIMHNFWADKDPSARMSNQINFHKNTALLGALWMINMVPQPWVFSLG